MFNEEMNMFSWN